MSETFDTLLYNNGTTKVETTLADWGLSNVLVHHIAQDIDTCDFVEAPTDVDSTPTFAVMVPGVNTSYIQIFLNRILDPSSPTGYSGGTCLFFGGVRDITTDGSGERENLSYHCMGPAWWLENQTYQDTFQIFSGYKTPNQPASGIETAPIYMGHLFLNRVNASDVFITSLAWLSTGEQIERAVDWAISHGAPMQLLADVPVVMNPGLTPYGLPAGRTAQISAGITTYIDVPVDEVVDITDLEVIRKQIRWTPDAVMWFDYTTAPFPTFMCQRRPSLNVVNLTALDGTWKELSKVKARYDLQKTFVSITFEVMNSVNGQSWIQPVVQTWPAPLGSLTNGFGGLVQTVRISGAQLQLTSVQLQTLAIPNQNNPAAQLQLLQLFNPWLTDSTVQSVQILNFSRAYANSPAMNYVLAPGSSQIPNWIPVNGASPLTINDTLTYQVQINYLNGQQEQRVMPIPVMATNLNTGGLIQTFTEEIGMPFAEPVPPQLAQELFNSLNPLQYSGEIVSEDAECRLTLGLGDVVNFADIPAYADMNAVVQEVEYQVDAGRTRVRFGPNRVLSAGDYIKLLQVTRNRLVLSAPNLINANAVQGGTNLNLGQNAAVGMPTKGAGYTLYSTVSDKPDGSNFNVLTDPTGLFGANGTPTGPAMLIQRGQPGVNGDKAILISYGDMSDVTVADGDGYKLRLRWYNVCVYNADGSTTVMKAKLMGSLPQSL